MKLCVTLFAHCQTWLIRLIMSCVWQFVRHSRMSCVWQSANSASSLSYRTYQRVVSDNSWDTRETHFSRVVRHKSCSWGTICGLSDTTHSWVSHELSDTTHVREALFADCQTQLIRECPTNFQTQLIRMSCVWQCANSVSRTANHPHGNCVVSVSSSVLCTVSRNERIILIAMNCVAEYDEEKI